MNRDPYEVLGVAPEAPADALKAAYRRLVRAHHPDVAPDKAAATALMAQINEAWHLVGDPEKRAAFDARARWQAVEHQERARQNEREARHLAEERARLEAQRRARLEAQRQELERARRLRGGGAKSKSGAPSAATPDQAAPRDAAPSRDRKSRPKNDKKSDASRDKKRPAPTRQARLGHKVARARQLHHEGRADEAKSLCRTVLLSDGRNVAARELLGDIFVGQGRYEYALMMFDQALQLAPRDLMLRRKRDQAQFAHTQRAGAPTHEANAPGGGAPGSSAQGNASGDSRSPSAPPRVTVQAKPQPVAERASLWNRLRAKIGGRGGAT